MGTDIHSYVEQQADDGTWANEPWPGTEVSGPFDWRSYNLFGFLADVRNYSAAPAVSGLRGLPADASDSVRKSYASWSDDSDGVSWLSVAELLAINYDATLEDRRDDGATVAVGAGQATTLRDFLGEGFFRDLATLQALNEQRPTRVVFWFDS